MTNQEKFIEVMNKYFDAGLTKENLRVKSFISGRCTPCGVFRVGACESFKCSKCTDWWGKEWKPKKGANVELPIPCTKTEEKTVKDWFQKINEELDEFKASIIFGTWHVECSVHKSWRRKENAASIAEEAADTITAITSMLEAMGIDENMRQEAQRRVNEKNKERRRF